MTPEFRAALKRETARPAESTVTRDADEHRDALRDDPGSYRWVGGELRDVACVPDEGDA